MVLLFQCVAASVLLILVSVSPVAAEQQGASEGIGKSERTARGAAIAVESSTTGSPYIPVDSWVYPAVWRLYAMGYANRVYLGMRPWTRMSVSHMMEETRSRIEDATTYGDSTAGEAQSIFAALVQFLRDDSAQRYPTDRVNLHFESVYTATRAISGTPLYDSFHLGSTLINDYGRPYENGLSNYTGASGYAVANRFTLYARGEFHAASSGPGYSSALGQMLSEVDGTSYANPDGIPYRQATIPTGPIGMKTEGRFIEAYLSVHVLNHEISFGKQDDWLGPGLGGSMAYSNNAENIYSFHINRVEPLDVPLLSRLTGPFRYELLIGRLRGHTYMPNPANPDGSNPNLANVINPGDPWEHLEKISFRPTENLEFGFERTAIWGGKGHAPITIHTFLKSFLSFASPPGNSKYGRDDPGARFGAFDFSYRLPFLRDWLTLYADSEVHDDVSPIDAPQRASWRPGVYLSHVPSIPKLDIRAEAATTDPSSSNAASQYGRFMYWETIQRQGYTNEGQLFGDWIGRQAKGGQGWITYHLSGAEWLQVGVRNQKATTYFIPGGTTVDDLELQGVKRLGRDLEVVGTCAYERWKAPVYRSGRQTVMTTTIQVTWFPKKKVGR